MANEQKLKATVTADITNYESNLKRASQIAKEEARKMEGAFSGSGGGGFLSNALSVATGGIIQSALSAIGGGILDVVKKGISMNDMFERSTIAFETMMGSSDKAAAHIKELASFAQNTSFQFPDVLIGSQRLQAMGFAGKEVIPIMRAIGDATAGVGGGADIFNRVVLALGQMKTKGKVSGEEIRQLAEAGIPAMKMLADSVGMTVSEFEKLAEKGTLKADVAIDILIKGMDKKFHGLQDRFSKETFSGISSNLEDRISMLAMIGTKDGFVQLKALMSNVLDQLGSSALEGVVRNIGSKGGAAVGVVNEMFKTLTGGGLAKELKEATITSDIPAIQKQLDRVSSGEVGNNFANMSVTSDVPAIQNQLNKIGASIPEGLASGIVGGASANPIMGAINWLIDTMVIGQSKDKLKSHSPSEVFEEIGQGIDEGLQKGIEANADQAGQGIDTLFTKMIDRTSAGYKKWKDQIDKIGGDAFLEKVEAIAKQLGTNPNWLMNVMALESSMDPSRQTGAMFKGKDGKMHRGSGSGLIQVTEATAEGMGTTSADIRKMSGMDQLELVAQYLGHFEGYLKTQSDVYSAILSGRIRPGGEDTTILGMGSTAKSREAYKANRWLDLDKNEQITKKEVGQSLQRIGGFTDGPVKTSGGSMNVFITNGADLLKFMDPSRIKSATTTGATDLPFNNLTKTSDLWSLIGIEGNLPGDARTATNLFAMMNDTLAPMAARMSEAEKAWTQFDADSKKFMTPDAGPVLTEKQQQAKNRKDLGLNASQFKPWDMAAKTFQDSFMDAIGHVQDGFKSMVSTFVIDIAQGLAKIAAEILAANLAKLIFNYDGTEGSAQKSGGGLLGKILGIGIGLVAGAVGGHIGNSFSANPSGLPLGIPGGSGVGLPLGIPGRAGGGDVRAGNLYMTGERGRELFVPKSDGSIVNNDQLNGMGGGRSITVVNHFHITSPDGKIAPESQRQAAERMMAALQRAA